MKKRILAALLAALMLLAAGCGGQSNKANSSVRGGSGSFCVAVGTEPDGFNPFTAQAALSREFFLLCYDPLWRVGADYEPESCLVESYDLSSDGLTWTIRLHRGVSFADEAHTPLTSADVKFSYELFMQYGQNTDDFDGIRSIDCPDDYTVIITTDFVKGDMMYTEVPILPKALWSACSTAPASMDNTAMVGTGPFVYQPVELGAGETQTEWRFTARADYFAGRAYIDELVFRCYDLTTNASNALVDGLADACMDLTDVQLFSLENEVGIETFEVLGPNRGYCELVMNTASGALSDSVVRDAILYAMDKESIYLMGFGDVGQQEDAFIGPRSPYHTDESDRFTLDPAQSAVLLAGSLYQDYDGDGVLESRDNTMELRFRLYSGTEDSWATAAATVLARDLAELGFSIDWITLEPSELQSRCRKGGDWDLCLLSHEGSIDPQDMAARYAGGRNLSGWQSESFDSAYEQLRHCLNKEQRVELCRSLQRTVMDSYPGTVVGYRSTVQAIRADKWTGYGETTASLGGLFGTGSYATYMNLRLQGTEAAEAEAESEMESEMESEDMPADFETDFAPATAVPLETSEERSSVSLPQ